MTPPEGPEALGGTDGGEGPMQTLSFPDEGGSSEASGELEGASFTIEDPSGSPEGELSESDEDDDR